MWEGVAIHISYAGRSGHTCKLYGKEWSYPSKLWGKEWTHTCRLCGICYSIARTVLVGTPIEIDWRALSEDRSYEMLIF